MAAEPVPRVFRRHAAGLRLAVRRSVHVSRQGDRLFLVVCEVLLPPGRFAVATSDMLILADTGYPASALDTFYLEPGVVRIGGAIPQNADQIEGYLDRQWRRFSWHSKQAWNPAGNPLCDHFAFAEQRLVVEPLA